MNNDLIFWLSLFFLAWVVFLILLTLFSIRKQHGAGWDAKVRLDDARRVRRHRARVRKGDEPPAAELQVGKATHAQVNRYKKAYKREVQRGKVAKR